MINKLKTVYDYIDRVYTSNIDIKDFLKDRHTLPFLKRGNTTYNKKFTVKKMKKYLDGLNCDIEVIYNLDNDKEYYIHTTIDDIEHFSNAKGKYYFYYSVNKQNLYISKNINMCEKSIILECEHKHGIYDTCDDRINATLSDIIDDDLEISPIFCEHHTRELIR